MSSSSCLWPKGSNKDLIISVANYLETLLTENKSSLDEVASDSLQIATESLQTIINPDDDTLPQPKFSLTDLYNLYTTNNPQQEEKKQESSKPLPSNIQKRREKFLEFIKVLQKHDFFKGCPQGSNDYQKRMEKARSQYNTRFPNMSIDSLQWLAQPMDTDNNNNKQPTEDDKKIAEGLKAEGNKLLGQKQYQGAIDKYTQAIKYNSCNAVYFSNRAAAHTYLRNYKQAVIDARKASDIDPNYVKAYVRQGLAEYEMGNYEAAHESYSKALNKTKSTDKNWETYMEKVELCQMKMDEANNENNNNATNNNPLGGMGGMGGGQPDLSNLLGSLGGGGGGPGGMDFSKIMQNPMMQQMAQQMMQDPNAMKKMGDLMKQFGGGGGVGGQNDANNNNNNNESSGGADVNEVMQDLLQNPEKAQRIFSEAMDDPEVKELMRQDPSIEPLINRIKTGDYAAFMELGSKPEAIAKVKGLIQKYYNK